MATLITWGTFQFSDSEVTSLEWDTPQTEYVSIPKVTGYPNVQMVGDTLGRVSIGLRFSGATAKSRFNALRLFAIGEIALLQQDTTPFGFFRAEKLKANYQLLINDNQTAIAVTLDLVQDP